MIYILDTNILSATRKPELAPAVSAWLEGRREDELFLSVITLGEIEKGIVRKEKSDPTFAGALREWLSRTVSVFADRILPFISEDARVWGRLSAQLGHAGADLMIAAQALHRNAVIVTRNVADFAPTGALVENPFATHPAG